METAILQHFLSQKQSSDKRESKLGFYLWRKKMMIFWRNLCIISCIVIEKGTILFA